MEGRKRGERLLNYVAAPSPASFFGKAVLGNSAQTIWHPGKAEKCEAEKWGEKDCGGGATAVEKAIAPGARPSPGASIRQPMLHRFR